MKMDMECYLQVLDMDQPDRISEEKAVKVLGNIEDSCCSIISEWSKCT